MAIGVRQGEITYITVVAAKGAAAVVLEILVSIAGALEFHDLSSELPKELPYRCEVNHCINLVPGVVTPSHSPYRIAPTELQ